MVIALAERASAAAPPKRVQASAHLSFAGFAVSVVSASPACLARLRFLCEAFITEPVERVNAEVAITVEPGDPAGAFIASEGSRLLRQEATPERLASRLEWWLCNEAIQRNSHLLHFHAAAVSKHGVAVLIPAVSGAGKSTLTLGLLARGFDVLGDDLTFIEPARGEALPFWRSFHLDVRSVVLLRRLGVPLVNGATQQYTFPPSAFGLHQFPAPAPLRYVVLPQREGLAPGALVEVDQAAALLAVMPHSTALRRGDRAAVAAAARLIGGARCFQLGSADLRLAVEALDRLVRVEPHPRPLPLTGEGS